MLVIMLNSGKITERSMRPTIRDKDITKVGSRMEIKLRIFLSFSSSYIREIVFNVESKLPVFAAREIIRRYKLVKKCSLSKASAKLSPAVM